MQPVRTCGTCTECCKGWLWGSAYDKKFYPGMPCPYMGNGCCTIYEDRPKDPCQTYRCIWLIDNEIPEWMKPEHSKIILTARPWGEDNSKVFLEASECGQKIDSSALNWLFGYFLRTETPLKVQIGGGWNYYGSEEFLKWNNV